MPDLTTIVGLHDVRCAGCTARVGLTSALQLRTRVYCTYICADQPMVGSNEPRDDMIVLLRALGHRQVDLSKLFGISRQRVADLVRDRAVDVEIDLT